MGGFKLNPLIVYTYGKGKPILHTGSCLAHYASVSQEGIFAEIRKRPPKVVEMAL
jgi:hypothetical protein